MLAYRSVDIRKSLQFEELVAREELEYLIEEEVAKLTIRNWLNRCLKRIKATDQTSVINTLQRSNELAFFREAQGGTTTEPLKKIITVDGVEGEERKQSLQQQQQSPQPLSPQQLLQKQGSKKKLDKTMTLPTPSADMSVRHTPACDQLSHRIDTLASRISTTEDRQAFVIRQAKEKDRDEPLTNSKVPIPVRSTTTRTRGARGKATISIVDARTSNPGGAISLKCPPRTQTAVWQPDVFFFFSSTHGAQCVFDYFSQCTPIFVSLKMFNVEYFSSVSFTSNSFVFLSDFVKTEHRHVMTFCSSHRWKCSPSITGMTMRENERCRPLSSHDSTETFHEQNESKVSVQHCLFIRLLPIRVASLSCPNDVDTSNAFRITT